MPKYALLSVSDKTDLLDFAKALHALDWQLLSTGKTAQYLRQAGIASIEVADHTGFPEMLNGRVKTLHPKIHAGLLATPSTQDQAALAEYDIPMIDLVVVNLYPFIDAINGKPMLRNEEAIEWIDIGGPAMLRSAAKNYERVTVVVDPDDYTAVLAELGTGQNQTKLSTRERLAQKVFAHTANYDTHIAAYFDRHTLPEKLELSFTKMHDLRYGENPQQHAAFYREHEVHPCRFACHQQLQGKPLSYNNLTDADLAWQCVQSFEAPSCVIVKHANPCGIASAAQLAQAYEKALASDPVSAFGGIIALNRPCDVQTATSIMQKFVEVVIAPEFSEAVQHIFAQKSNIRLLAFPLLTQEEGADFLPQQRSLVKPKIAANFDYRKIDGGLLVQTKIDNAASYAGFTVVSRNKPSEAEWPEILFAHRAVAWAKSNAIVFCADQATIAIGSGQMSRLDAVHVAKMKAHHMGHSLAGSWVASDAFFPFRDGVDEISCTQAKGVIQPGGSQRDAQVIAAADEKGLIMIFTNQRQFRH